MRKIDLIQAVERWLRRLQRFFLWASAVMGVTELGLLAFEFGCSETIAACVWTWRVVNPETVIMWTVCAVVFAIIAHCLRRVLRDGEIKVYDHGQDECR